MTRTRIKAPAATPKEPETAASHRNGLNDPLVNALVNCNYYYYCMEDFQEIRGSGDLRGVSEIPFCHLKELLRILI